MGNHDVRWQAGGWAEALERYLRYNGEYMGDHGGRPYFDHWINGYHFIAMNTEKDLKDDAYLSDEQLGWLEQKLGEEAEPGKPIFLVLHQPLRNTHPLSSQSGVNVGAQSDKLKGILAKYPQTVFFTGHIHNGFGYSPIVDEGYGVLVDVPSMAYNNRGYSGNAVCYYVNVYENGIKLRARDFASEIWMPEYDHSVPFNFKQAGGLGVNRE